MELYPGYKNGHIFTFSQLTEFIEESCDEFGIDLVSSGNNLEYLNVPCSFDIETTSFILNKESKKPIKVATMYIWQFGLNGSVIYGRKWEDFFVLLQTLDDYLGLCSDRRLIIYVHNLMFEFQFIRNWIEWDKVFAPKNRRPVYAIAGGFEFRCSYFLSNMSLAYIGKEMLHKYPIEKMVGDLDYSKIRHSNTPLTEAELKYCINDVKVVMSYIQEKIESDGDISKIPLTNTGYIRNYCRNRCFYSIYTDEEEKRKCNLNYHALMKSLTLNDEFEYKMLKHAFAGGFTHASILHVNKILESKNVGLIGSADIASSYPYAMVGQYFPMTKGKYIGTVTNKADFEHYLAHYCCLFEIAFYNIKPLVDYENYIPYYKCYIKGKAVENNGRLVSAEFCALSLTELDFDIINRIYTWEKIEIFNMYIYEKDYLPKDLILSILDLYEDKTTLKGILEKVVEYMVKKNMTNSSYGMMVTDIIRDDISYIENDWKITEANSYKQISKYNKSYNRFLSYPWGVWVTAHARHNVWQAIMEFKSDYIYCDTDSIKGLNFEKHMPFFERYNNEIKLSLLDMCNEYNISFSKCAPKTNKGVTKLLGVFEIEDSYVTFKTSGAKRYMYTYENGFTTFTIAGMKKTTAMPFLIAENNNIPLDSDEFKRILSAYSGESKEDKEWLLKQPYDYYCIFEAMGDSLYVPEEYSGRMEAVYNDKALSGVLVDYLGNIGIYSELSSLYIGKSKYYMSMAEKFRKFIENYETIVTV